MAAAVEGARRTLRGERDHAVYGRTGKPCQRCGSSIACYSHGEPPRWTWSCPVCQLAIAPRR
jgi:endonuclease-8